MENRGKICSSVERGKTKVLVALFSIFLFFAQGLSNISGQINTEKKYSGLIQNSVFSDTILMGGKLDGFNTYTRKSSFLIGDSGIYRAFEPMKSITIKNTGSSKIFNPKIVFNKHGNWYDIKSVAEEALGDASNDRETFLSLWQFMRDNRIHYSPANFDSYDGFKMLTAYGYGTCELTTWNLHLILDQLGYRSYSLTMPGHTVTGVEYNGGRILLDADAEVFYLDKNNKTFATEEEVLNDKYLISRTKHFGKDTTYNKDLDQWMSGVYYSTKRVEDSDLKSRLTGFKLNSRLRPGESLIYNYGKADKYCHIWSDGVQIPENFLVNIIANGAFVYSTNFLNAPLDELVDGSIAEGVNKDLIPHLYTQADSGIIKLYFDSSFPILDSKLTAKYFKSADTDSIEVFYSDDDIVYKKIYTVASSGTTLDSISLNNNFNYSVYGQKLPVVYRYFLKFRFIRSAVDNLVGLDSIYVKNTFQVSRFFLPELKLGNNLIQFSDSVSSGEQKIQLTVDWKETESNTPPDVVHSPYFPAMQATVDSLNFDFTWPEPVDRDGDKIADYEFFLSDSKKARFPLSPNFNLFTSALGHTYLSHFRAKEPGWLLNDSIYFWKVRAKDSRGAWSEWSPVWSFRVKGIMPPVKGFVTVLHDSIIINWRKSNYGQLPHHYNIYGSDISHGFYPGPDNFIGSTTDTIAYIVHDKKSAPKSFYRVTAASGNKQESYPSDYFSVPSTVFYSDFDSVRPFERNSLKIFRNRILTPYYDGREDTTVTSADVLILQMPEWISFENNEFYGIPDEEDCRRMVFKTLDSRILVRTLTQYNISNDFGIDLKSALKNNKPSLFISESKLFSQTKFLSAVSSDNGDLLYGDSLKYEILKKPAWLIYYISNDTLFLSGYPDGSFAPDSLIVKAIDSKGLISVETFILEKYTIPFKPFSVFPNPVTNTCTLVSSLRYDSNIDVYLYNSEGILINKPLTDFYCSKTELIPLDFGNIKTGVYFLKIIIKNTVNKDISSSTLKIVKTR